MERSIKETRENRNRRAQQGFTLLEILVVVLIIGTIASLVTVKVLDRLEQAKHSAAMIQMNSFKQALDLFRLDNGFYPETEQGLRAEELQARGLPQRQGSAPGSLGQPVHVPERRNRFPDMERRA